MLIFRDSDKSSNLDADHLEAITSYDFNVSHFNPPDQSVIYEFGKEIFFIIKQKGRKSNTDKTLIKFFKSLVIMASGVSTMFL